MIGKRAIRGTVFRSDDHARFHEEINSPQFGQKLMEASLTEPRGAKQEARVARTSRIDARLQPEPHWLAVPDLYNWPSTPDSRVRPWPMYWRHHLAPLAAHPGVINPLLPSVVRPAMIGQGCVSRTTFSFPKRSRASLGRYG